SPARPQPASGTPGTAARCAGSCVVPALARLGEPCECVDERAQLTPALGQAVFDARRTGVDHLSIEHAGLFEVDKTLRQRRRRNATQRLQKLVEAESSRMRDVEDRNGPAPLE